MGPTCWCPPLARVSPDAAARAQPWLRGQPHRRSRGWWLCSLVDCSPGHRPAVVGGGGISIQLHHRDPSFLLLQAPVLESRPQDRVGDGRPSALGGCSPSKRGAGPGAAAPGCPDALGAGVPRGSPCMQQLLKQRRGADWVQGSSRGQFPAGEAVRGREHPLAPNMRLPA